MWNNQISSTKVKKLDFEADRTNSKLYKKSTVHARIRTVSYDRIRRRSFIRSMQDEFEIPSNKTVVKFWPFISHSPLQCFEECPALFPAFTIEEQGQTTKLFTEAGLPQQVVYITKFM